MRESLHRRRFLEVAAVTGLSAGLASRPVGGSELTPTSGEAARPCSLDDPAHTPKSFLTKALEFVDVSRGNPKPSSLEGEARAKARLTPETWRLEIVSDGSAELPHPCRTEDGSALSLPALEDLGRTQGVKFLKGMQCNNIPVPLGQGLWEGVPLRVVLDRVGIVNNVRRVFYWGFHNNDPAQLFQSSLGYNHVMETPPWDLPPIVAYRLNGEPIPPQRGGPVRMIVPWSHGFKSIKWLQRIVLTNDYKANDTYALQNNDPDSYLKTAAYLHRGPKEFKAGEPVVIEGSAMAGWSGLKRVEFWIRPDPGTQGKIADDDPAWKSARWQSCEVMPPPDDWGTILPEGISAKEIWGFDSSTGKPKDWPLRYSVVSWSAVLRGLEPGPYEFRVRAVDLNGFAQPEPRTYQKSGMNRIQCRPFVVTS
jgi:DMSO/TMAO reductase YedYZ molybdopterin-dependent catalytic subunit